MTGPRAPRWFLREPSPDSGARLFCLPYSGCGASMYRKWPRRVADIEICPVQFPGRESRMREDPFTSFGALADMLCEALVPYLDRPFAVFGHCSSALVAYETALRLQRRGYRVPTRLFVSSQVAPHKGPHGRFLEMSEDELRVQVSTLITALGGNPRPDLVELSLRVLVSDVEAHKRYGVSDPTPMPCQASVLGWDEDVEVPHELLHDWSDLGETTFRVLKGPHYGFVDGPQALMRVFEMDLGCAAAEPSRTGLSRADPTGAGSAVRPPRWPEVAARAELEAALLRRLRVGAATIPQLPRPGGTARFPASLTQEETYAKYQAHPAPVVLAGLRVRGPLDVAAMEGALNAVADRHEILRTSFELVESGLTQVIAPAVRLELPVTDGTLADFDAVTRAEVGKPWDLERGPLVRVRLLRLTDDDHIVIVVLHHIIADARSVEVFFADLAAAYVAASAGAPAALPPLPVQYGDYAAWQRERLTGATRAEKIDYWVRRLAGAQPVRLPLDMPGAGQLDDDGDILIVAVPGGLLADLRDCVRERDTTLFVGALAAFQILLARYCGSRDIAVPVPVTFRDRAEVRDLIGSFVYTMVSRTDLTGEPSFASVLAQVRGRFADDLDHVEVSSHLVLPHLVNDNIDDLFDSLEFGVDRVPEAENQGTGLRVEPLPPRWPYALRPLSVRFRHSDRNAELALTYRYRDVSRSRVTDLASDYLDVLTACVGRPRESPFGPDAPSLRVG